MVHLTRDDTGCYCTYNFCQILASMSFVWKLLRTMGERSLFAVNWLLVPLAIVAMLAKLST